MPPPQTFTGLGVFVQTGFLDADLRETLASWMRDAPSTAAAVERAAGAVVDPDERRAEEVAPPPSLGDGLDRRLRVLTPAIEEAFGEHLPGAEPLGLLRYGPGSFYRPHRDRARRGQARHDRAVSIVIFVNGAGVEGGFEGGALRFYGLLGEGPLAEVGLDLVPEAGTLVAFRSEWLHEVTPVLAGWRYTAVTWLTR